MHSLDIFHVHYAIPHATSGYLAKQLLGKRSPVLITTLHGTDITLVGRDPAYAEIVRFSIDHSDAVTTVSESLRKETRDVFGTKRSIEVIYNFFSPDEQIIDRAALRKMYAPGGEKLIAHASNFRHVKRVEDVIAIFHGLQKSFPCKLLLLGTGAGIEDVRAQVNALQLQNHVVFLGKCKDAAPYIASSDLFLLPSAHESFGLVALEALSYGVPVVASNVGGIPEVITHGKTGFLAPVGDTTAMLAYAKQILTDPSLQKSMGESGKKTAQEKFSPEKIVPQYEQLYTAMLRRTIST